MLSCSDAFQEVSVRIPKVWFYYLSEQRQGKKNQMVIKCLAVIQSDLKSCCVYKKATGDVSWWKLKRNFKDCTLGLLINCLIRRTLNIECGSGILLRWINIWCKFRLRTAPPDPDVTRDTWRSQVWPAQMSCAVVPHPTNQKQLHWLHIWSTHVPLLAPILWILT